MDALYPFHHIHRQLNKNKDPRSSLAYGSKVGLMIAPIERLPTELFQFIASDLEDLQSFHALRLTCSQLYILSFLTYSRRYFSELTTTLGSASLDRLVEVSKHEYLSQAVTVLDIRLLCHRDYKVLTKISRVGIFPIPRRFPKLSGVKPEHVTREATLYDDLMKRDHPRCIVDRLVCALRAFSKLKSIRFRAYHNEPHGWHSSAMPDGDQLFRSKCFDAVINAIIKSEIILEEFSLARGKRMTTLSRCANLVYPALTLPFETLKALQFSFATLKTLTLSTVAAHNGNARIPGWENGLANLIAIASPTVQDLALSLDRDSCISHYSAAVVRSLALSCRMPNLRSFQLVNSKLHEADLVAFTTVHKNSLCEIILADIKLLTGSWISLWTSFQDLHSLQCLRLASLEGVQSPVLFKKRNKDGFKIRLDVNQAERPMINMLDDLISASSSTPINFT